MRRLSPVRDDALPWLTGCCDNRSINTCRGICSFFFKLRILSRIMISTRLPLVVLVVKPWEAERSRMQLYVHIGRCVNNLFDVMELLFSTWCMHSSIFLLCKLYVCVCLFSFNIHGVELNGTWSFCSHTPLYMYDVKVKCSEISKIITRHSGTYSICRWILV